jgi:hypothetical protein
MKAFHKFNQFNPYENKSLATMNIAEVGRGFFPDFSGDLSWPGGGEEGGEDVWR